jgi:CBS domain-containing protein
MNVADIMTRKVISVTPETTIAEAAQLLLDNRISGLPVVDPGGAVVGIVTEGDLLRRVETGTQRRHSHWLEFLIAPGRLAREYTDANARKVGEVMSPEVVSVTPRESLPEVVRLMEHHHVKRLPVIEAGRLVGIVSRANLVRALLDSLAERPVKPAGEPPSGDGVAGDAEIRERILAEIAKQPWGPRASVDVRVKAGTVELDGTITDERERTALQVLAEKIPGVTTVRDNLVWIEPVSGFVIPAVASKPPPES